MPRSQTERVLRQHLQTDRLLGVEFVPVGLKGTGETQSPIPVTTSSVAGQDVNENLPKTSLNREPSAQAMDRQSKLKILEAIDLQEVRGCTKCDLCRNRTNTVFGEGDPDAKLMFIGEGPGENEDLQGRPFVGAAGEMLNKQIAAMGLSRERVYITNIVKCRPPQNRAPTVVEVEACADYLRRQIMTIRPAVIVTLGGPATKTLLKTDKGITVLRGVWHQYQELEPQGLTIPVMPTFHPAYLLRAYTPENRGKVWSDLQKVMRFLNEHAPEGSDA